MEVTYELWLKLNGYSPCLLVTIGQWHTIKSLESGTVLLEVQDGKWEVMKEEDVMEV